MRDRASGCDGKFAQIADALNENGFAIWDYSSESDPHYVRQRFPRTKMGKSLTVLLLGTIFINLQTAIPVFFAR
ncbi:hypothetical protein GCM10028804_54270 [Larkinella terrae]